MKIKPLETVLVASDICGVIMLKDKQYECKLSRPIERDNNRLYFIHPVYNCECIGYKRQFNINE